MATATSTLPELDRERLAAAYAQARDDLLDERISAGHWIGELSTSALSTATAISAMSVVVRHGSEAAGYDKQQLRDLITGGIDWLAAHQNEDGGYGDTTLSYSNVATTMLAVAAFHFYFPLHGRFRYDRHIDRCSRRRRIHEGR